MTYEESYMKCKTEKELKDEFKTDMLFAILWNPDRVQKIVEAMNKVALARNWDVTGVVE